MFLDVTVRVLSADGKCNVSKHRASHMSKEPTVSGSQSCGSYCKPAFLAATLAASMLFCLPAHAFNLGNLATLSALGEPLRLEFEVLDLSPTDAESLQVTLASPQSYATRGLGYGQSLDGLRMVLMRNATGKLVIRVEGQRPAAEPFVDLLLNITWASGATTRAVSIMLAPGPAPDTTTASAPSTSVAAGPLNEALKASSATEPSSTATTPVPSGQGTIVVQPGDTAGELALRELTPGVSQNQYLLALAKVNPSAFVEGNVNRLRAGASISLPTLAQAQATSAPEARQIIAAQWQEFQAFRQQTATSRPATAPERPVAEARGKIESLRSSPDTSTPSDKLTLSKPTAQGDGKADQALLNERQASDADTRLKELDRTVKELNQLQTKTGSADPASPSGDTAGPSTDSSTAASLAPAADLPAPQPAPGTSLVAQLADHPAVLPAAGGLLGLALAWLGLRLRRKTTAQGDEIATETGPELESLDDAVRLQAQPLSEPASKSRLQREHSPHNEVDMKLDLDLELDLDDETGRSRDAQARVKEASSQ